VDFAAPISTYIKFNYGDSMWTDLQNDLQNISSARQSFSQAR
jgi:hypothetical protein